MKGAVRRAGAWLADRLGLHRFRHVWDHPVPPGITDPRRGWLYALGSAAAAAFVLQLVTGIALATQYVPAPAHAYESVRYITDEVWMGALLRGMHYFGASAMVVLVAAHMARVFLTGSYKFPRELNWLTGVLLLVLTLAMAFTGQLLRWDADGVWGVFVASHYVGRVPGIGDALKEMVLAGETIGGATLTRFYALHAIVMPLLLLGTIGLHVWLVVHHGISEPPAPGQRVDRDTYRERYRRILEQSTRRYFPDAAWREALVSAVVVAVVFSLAIGFGPKGPGEPPDPTQVPAEPKPDWFLLWYYGLIAVKSPTIETFVMVYMPLGILAVLLLLPFGRGSRGERSARRRPWAVLATAAVISLLGLFTLLGARAPWVMDFDAAPPSVEEVAGLPPLARVGSQVFHARGCIQCHAVAGRGGTYGPPLGGVLDRLPPGDVTLRIVMGFGDMPAYGHVLGRDELDALMAYLHTLPKGDP